MSDWEFVPEDFSIGGRSEQAMSINRREAADQANAKLQKLLSEAPVAFTANKKQKWWSASTEPMVKAYQCRLVDIKEIEK